MVATRLKVLSLAYGTPVGLPLRHGAQRQQPRSLAGAGTAAAELHCRLVQWHACRVPFRVEVRRRLHATEYQG